MVEISEQKTMLLVPESIVQDFNKRCKLFQSY